MIIELGAHVDDADVLREQLAIQRQAGLGVRVALALEVPGLARLKPSCTSRISPATANSGFQ